MNDATFDDILNRLMTATGSKRESHLAAAIGVSHQALYNSKKKRAIPASWIFEISKKYNVSADWLFFGRTHQETPPEIPAGVYAELERKNERIAELEKELKESQAEALRAYRLAVEVLRPEARMSVGSASAPDAPLPRHEENEDK